MRVSDESREQGFTLIEVLVAIVVMGIVLTLSASAFRTYWLGRSLDTAHGEVISQLQQAQTRTSAESNPWSYGARFRVGSSRWDVVRYDTATGECTVVGEREFAEGVLVTAASFASNSAVDPSSCPDQTDSAFVFFFARGTATPGTMTVKQPILDRTRSLQVIGLTAKVRET